MEHTTENDVRDWQRANADSPDPLPVAASPKRRHGVDRAAAPLERMQAESRLTPFLASPRRDARTCRLVCRERGRARAQSGRKSRLRLVSLLTAGGRWRPAAQPS